MESRIAFVTCERLPEITLDDALAERALRARGVTALPAVWSDPAVDWTSLDAVVLRSTWDYHHRAAEFADWVARLDALGVPLWNPPAVVRWNLDKKYLDALAGAGAPTLRTVRLTRGSAPSLEQVLAAEGWTRAVVKPAISGGGQRTFRVARGDPPAAGRSSCGRCSPTATRWCSASSPRSRRKASGR